MLNPMFRNFPREGDTPYAVRTARTSQNLLFHSDPAYASVIKKNMAPNYGDILQGTVMAENVSAAGNRGKLIPYAPTEVLSEMTENEWYQIGRAFILDDTASGDTVIRVTLADAYKFVIGDEVIIEDNTTAPENLGAITAITLGKVDAQVTVTTGCGSTAFTTARSACIRVKTGAATPWSDAKCILYNNQQTGEYGYLTDPLLCTVIVTGPVTLYTNNGLLGNLDANAVTALGGKKIDSSKFRMA